MTTEQSQARPPAAYTRDDAEMAGRAALATVAPSIAARAQAAAYRDVAQRLRARAGTGELADAATELANLATWAQSHADQLEPRRPHPLDGVTVEQLAAAMSPGGAPTPAATALAQRALDMLGPDAAGDRA